MLHTFLLDGYRVLGQAWICRGCLDVFLTADRIDIGGDGGPDEAETGTV